MSTLKVNAVESASGGGVAAKISSVNGGQLGNRNMIINGAMQINNRSTGAETVDSSSSKFPCDRWVARGEGGSKTFTIQQVSIASSGQGVRHAIRVTSSQAASVGSNDIFNVRQMVEGFNVQRMNFGESGCKSMTLSFTARSSVAGTHSGAIQNSAQNRSYPFTYTLSADTWTDVSVTIPPITDGSSWNEDVGVGLRVVFDMGSGNTFRGPAGQWNSAQDEGATGSVRILENNGATWEVTKVQLEEGTIGTEYEIQNFQTEEMRCMRYFETFRLTSYPMQPAGNNGVNSETRYPYKVKKRAAPTVTKDGNLSLTLNGSNSNNTDHALGGGNTDAAKEGMHLFAVISGASYSSATMINSGVFLADCEL
jgi:hypothetical protein